MVELLNYRVIKLSIKKLEGKIQRYVGWVVLDLDQCPAPRNDVARDIDRGNKLDLFTVRRFATQIEVYYRFIVSGLALPIIYYVNFERGVRTGLNQPLHMPGTVGILLGGQFLALIQVLIV